jgi:hypothetical protein
VAEGKQHCKYFDETSPPHARSPEFIGTAYGSRTGLSGIDDTPAQDAPSATIRPRGE